MKPVALELIREVNPAPDADALVDLTVREQTLREVIQSTRAQCPGPPRRPHEGRWRVLAVVVVVSLGLAAVALAASGILAGSPYRVPHAPRVNRNARLGTGVVVSGSARLLALRVPDPAGGPAWGVRVLRTTRGLGCVQVGRVVNGLLGVLGQDGVAGNDHRFHVLSPDLVQMEDCALPDGRQHLFIDNETDSGYASGPVFTPRSCAYPGEGSGQPQCPAADRRMLAYGLLGPNAKSLTYRAGGHPVTEATVGPAGAYLVVLPGTARGTTGLASGSPDLFPGALAVSYRDGRTCRPSQRTGGCARDGYATVTTPPVRVLPVTVHATIRTRREHGNRNADLLVSFRAPLAITNAQRSYTVATTMPPACGTIEYTNLDRDIRRGARVTLDMPLPVNCPGTATARLELTRTNPNLVGPDPVIASLATFRFKLSR